MKKRKKPTGLIIALVLFVMTAAGINAFQMGLLRPSGPPPATETLSEKRETTDTSKDIARNTKSSLGEMKKKAMALDGDGPTPRKPGTPLIATSPIKREKYVPKPNDSSIATQWYAPESMNSQKK
jgi:hypothetical protein